jgi:hypothetical protein
MTSDRERHDNDGEAVGGILDAGQDLDRAVEPGRHRQAQAARTPNQAHEFVEKQDQAEGAEDVVEMVAAIQPPHRNHLQRHADQKRGEDCQHSAEHEAAGPGGEGRGEIGAQHVQRAVRQVDEVHDAEDERQPRCQQEQQKAELQAVQALLDKKRHLPPECVTAPAVRKQMAAAEAAAIRFLAEFTSSSTAWRAGSARSFRRWRWSSGCSSRRS